VGEGGCDVEGLRVPHAAARTEVLERFGVSAGDYVLATAHRPGNVDDPARLERLVALLEAVPHPVVLPLHPRTAGRLDGAGLRGRLERGGVVLAPPLGYLDFTALLHHARALLTDSGGVQKEAYLAGVPCVTLRAVTEWTETVEAGWNVLVDLDADAAVAALGREPPAARPPLYGDGRAGERVVAALARRMGA
jgi:UDP-GlcNAc3NAcA epimerase